MATANEQLFDAFVRHQILLLRYRGNVSNEVVKRLNETEASLAAKIRERMATMNGLERPSDWRKLNRLLKQLESIRGESWRAVETYLETEMADLAQNENDFLVEAILAALMLVVSPSKVTKREINRIIKSRPFEGRTLREWVRHNEAEDNRRIRAVVQAGAVSRQSGQQVAQAVVGTRNVQGSNGVTQTTRNGVNALAWTAVSHVSNSLQRAFTSRNSDIVGREQYTAVLDTKTTALCRDLDGDIYAVGEGPIPPMHMNCRSRRIPVFDQTTLSRHPLRPDAERNALREYGRTHGVAVVTTRADLPRGHKGAFDRWKRQHVEGLIGTTARHSNYADWLRKQSKTAQEQALGKTKAKLFREGKLSLDKFVNRAGDELNLSQLATLEAQAFRAAGLDPDSFR